MFLSSLNVHGWDCEVYLAHGFIQCCEPCGPIAQLPSLKRGQRCLSCHVLIAEVNNVGGTQCCLVLPLWW